MKRQNAVSRVWHTQMPLKKYYLLISLNVCEFFCSYILFALLDPLVIYLCDGLMENARWM